MKFAIALLLPVLAGTALAAEPERAKLEDLFPRMATVTTAGARVSRLELPPEVLSDCRQDFSDLRLFDSSGSEVPYLLDEGLDDTAAVGVREEFPAQFRNVQRRSDLSANRRVFTESYELSLPLVDPGQPWTLELRSANPSFVVEARVEALTAGQSAQALTGAESFFRLSNPYRQKLSLQLPPLPPSVRSLKVTLEGEGGFIDPTFVYSSNRSIPSRPSHMVGLGIVGQTRQGGRTTVEVSRPRGQSFDSLLLDVPEDLFRRRVEVWDVGPGAADVPVAITTIYRVRAARTSEQLSIALPPLKGDRLRLVIEDGDSPPLKNIKVFGRLKSSAIIFSLQGEGTLRFGGGRAHPPKYDLQSLKQALNLPNRGVVPVILRDKGMLGEARLGPIASNPSYDSSPALAFAMVPGAKLNPAAFSHRRLLEVPQSQDGLVRCTLGEEDLSHLRPDLGDVRIVDTQNHQWAYIIGKGNRSRISLAATGPEKADGGTSYSLSPPHSPAVLDNVNLYVKNNFVNRPYVLYGIDDSGRKITLQKGQLTRNPRDAGPFEISFPKARLASLELFLADGNDAPIVLQGAGAEVAGAEIHFVAPAGNYELLLGNPSAPPPTYELSRVQDLVFAVRSEAVSAGQLEKNPRYSPGARLAADGGYQMAALWTALSGAVLALIVVTLRLIRHENPVA